MAYSSSKQLDKTITDKHINYFDHNNFIITEKISEGECSSIFKAIWKDYGLTIAIKRYRINTNSDENIKELQIWQKLNFHPNINCFYGISKDPFDGSYDLIFGFANDGDLRQYMKNKFLELKWSDKFRMAEEIAQGLRFLHKNNIIHLDLHSRNVLVHEGRMMISDFGFSKHIDEASMSGSTNFGMPAYLEPQAIKNSSYTSNKKSDIYSLGVIFWEISSGKPPFCTFTTKEAIAIYIYQGKRENPIDGTPSEYIELYTRCWDDDPEKRPDIEIVLEDLNRINSIDSSI